MINGKGDV